MFTDERRSRLHDAIQRQDNQLFSQILTPELFVQAARLCRLPLVHSPLNLVNLVWLALSAARNPEQSFADLLELPLKTLQDHEAFAGSDLDQLRGAAQQPPRPSPRRRHDPHGGPPERVSAQAFAQARQRMPPVFWLALFLLLGEEFQRRYAALVRWQRFRLLAVDGTRLNLPDYPALGRWRCSLRFTSNRFSVPHFGHLRMRISGALSPKLTSAVLVVGSSVALHFRHL